MNPPDPPVDALDTAVLEDDAPPLVEPEPGFDDPVTEDPLFVELAELAELDPAVLVGTLTGATWLVMLTPTLLLDAWTPPPLLLACMGMTVAVDIIICVLVAISLCGVCALQKSRNGPNLGSIYACFVCLIFALLLSMHALQDSQSDSKAEPGLQSAGDRPTFVASRKQVLQVA